MSANPQEQDVFTPRVDLQRVLIVERDPDSMQALRGSLAQAGFTVTILNRGEDALAAIDRHRPHLVMLDWEYPGVPAANLIRHIHQETPAARARLIALSLYASEQQVVSGFELGVDDYVARPYSLGEVVARVKAVLRTRRPESEDPNVIRFHRLRMDLTDHRLMIEGHIVALRPMEFRLLEFLVRQPERVFTREQMRREVWPRDTAVDPRAIDVNVQRARKALARHGCGHYLQTVRAVGYRLSARK
jgi:two-component system phosphate regulon response regulator PhoB